MKDNTITIDVATYNELRDFRKYIECNYTYIFKIGGYDEYYMVLTSNNAIKKLHKVNIMLKNNNEELDKVHKDYNFTNEIKKTSFWKILKLKLC